MQKDSRRRPFRRLVMLGLMLLALGLATASQWEPAAQARPCCSSCPPDNMEDHCWDVCAFSC